MSENIVNWDAIVHKNVRTSDRVDAGNIIDIEPDTIVLERGPTTEYVIPKDKVEGFDGSEVTLLISSKELDQYKKMK
jgi:ferredoxin-fold anticodon binding domain-containing protein